MHQKLLISLLLLTAQGLTSSLAAQRLNPSHFTYLGAFALPQVVQNGEYINRYGQRGMYFDANGDPGGGGDGYPGSLWVNTHDYNRDYVEISIPVPVNSTSYNSLSSAGLLTNSLTLDMGTCSQEKPYLTGFTITDNFVWTSCSRWYNVGNNNHDNLYRWNLDFSSPVQLHAGPSSGPEYVHPNLTGSWVESVPADWAASNTGGRTLITGHSRNSHGGTLGPTIFALDEFDPEGSATTVLRYRQEPEFPSPSDCNTNQCDFPNYSACDRWWDAEWIDAAADDALIMVGKNCYGGSHYVTGQGWTCDPCYPEVIFYDPDDLAASATGLVDPWIPIPYETWRPNEAWQTNGHFGGAAYDADNGILYLVEKNAEGGNSIVHVYSLGKIIFVDRFEYGNLDLWGGTGYIFFDGFESGTLSNWR